MVMMTMTMTMAMTMTMTMTIAAGATVQTHSAVKSVVQAAPAATAMMTARGAKHARQDGHWGAALSTHLSCSQRLFLEPFQIQAKVLSRRHCSGIPSLSRDGLVSASSQRQQLLGLGTVWKMAVVRLFRRLGRRSPGGVASKVLHNPRV